MAPFYIGITYHFPTRLGQHRQRFWTRDFEMLRLSEHSSMLEAGLAEGRYIQTLERRGIPLLNISKTLSDPRRSFGKRCAAIRWQSENRATRDDG